MQRSCIRIPRLNHGENPSKPGTPMPKPQDSPWPRNGEPQAWNRILYLTTNPLLLFTSFPFSLSLASPIPPTTYQHEHRPTDNQLPISPLGPAFPKNYSFFLTKQELLSLPTAPRRSRLSWQRSEARVSSSPTQPAGSYQHGSYHLICFMSNWSPHSRRINTTNETTHHNLHFFMFFLMAILST